ncbi:MAG: secondary thiamine-phosphate synthase enzyme YjbQ [bacterium]
MKKLIVNTRQRTDFVNISTDIQQAATDAGLKNGLLTVFIPHTTAGVTINENADPDVMEDVAVTLDRIVPWNAGYAHSEGNAAAHVKASLMGSSVRVPVEDGRLRLGTWQGIYFCEFDGPRKREAWIISD